MRSLVRVTVFVLMTSSPAVRTDYVPYSRIGRVQRTPLLKHYSRKLLQQMFYLDVYFRRFHYCSSVKRTSFLIIYPFKYFLFIKTNLNRKICYWDYFLGHAHEWNHDNVCIPNAPLIQTLPHPPEHVLGFVRKCTNNKYFFNRLRFVITLAQ